MSVGIPFSWTDSHCHLDFEDFAKDGIAAVISRAHDNHVDNLLTISTHVSRLPRYLAIVDRHASVWTTIGVHPHQANEKTERDVTVKELIQLAQSHPKIVAIGECGLDYHYDYAPHEVQKKMFRVHIEAALQTGLPLIIHAREADDDIIALLSEVEGRGLTGVMHCFSSSPELAEYALNVGFFISFSGILTFPKAREIQAISRTVPLDRILVETDAPYLAPLPHRGQRNEPAYVRDTGSFLAGLREVDEAKMARQTTENFFNLFKKVERTL